jgi:hypothetical protein
LGVLFASTSPVAAESEAEQAASSPTPIVTDRPTDSASPELVPRHAWQFEMGYKFSRADGDSGRVDTQELPDLLIRFGINERIEARFVGTDWTLKDQATGKEDGLSDITLGAKFALAEERGRRPQMALLADVSLPVGGSGFSDDYVIPRVLFLATNNLTDRLGLTYNFGPKLVTSNDDDGRRSDLDFNYAVALSGPISGPLSLFGEIFGVVASGRGRPDSHTFQAGALLLVKPNSQLDIRGGIGLVDNVPKWLVGAGLAFRLPH